MKKIIFTILAGIILFVPMISFASTQTTTQSTYRTLIIQLIQLLEQQVKMLQQQLIVLQSQQNQIETKINNQSSLGQTSEPATTTDTSLRQSSELATSTATSSVRQQALLIQQTPAVIGGISKSFYYVPHGSGCQNCTYVVDIEWTTNCSNPTIDYAAIRRLSDSSIAVSISWAGVNRWDEQDIITDSSVIRSLDDHISANSLNPSPTQVFYNQKAYVNSRASLFSCK